MYSERAEVTVIWMLQPHFIFYCALCLVRTVSHKQRIYRVTINESRAADIPLTLSECASLTPPRSLRHYCYFYFTRFVLYLNFVRRPSPHPRLSFAYPSLSLAGPSRRSHFYNSVRPYGTYPRYVRLTENLFTTPMPHTNLRAWRCAVSQRLKYCIVPLLTFSHLLYV